MEIIKKSNNPFKMWGFWICFVIGFLIIFFGGMKSFGCNPEWRSWNDGIYFGIETFGGIGSGSCYNVVSPVHKYCSVVESHYKINDENFNFNNCLKNHNNYHYGELTVDNVKNTHLSYYDGGRVFGIDVLLERIIFSLLFALIIFGTIGWGIHSLIRKLIILFKKFKKSAI